MKNAAFVVLALSVLTASCQPKDPQTPIAPTVSAEQETRREASQARVVAAGFEPVLEAYWRPPTSITPRSVPEVSGRAIAVMLTAIKGERGEQSLVNDGLALFGERAVFSADETLFIENDAPETQARVDYSWRFECLHVFLWALGYSELHGPAEAADIGTEVSLVQEAGTLFGEGANPRTSEELLAEADYYETLLAGARAMRSTGGIVPETMDYSVVYERTRAFRWLVRLAEDWDAISMAPLPDPDRYPPI